MEFLELLIYAFFIGLGTFGRQHIVYLRKKDILEYDYKMLLNSLLATVVAVLLFGGVEAFLDFGAIIGSVWSYLFAIFYGYFGNDMEHQLRRWIKESR